MADTPEHDQAYIAIASLMKADRIRLLRIAQRYAFGCALSPEDLLQEAVARTLSGARVYKATLGIVGFLAGAMKSIAFDERKKTQTHALDLAVSDGDLDDPIPDLNAERSDSEEGAERIELLRLLVKNNENAALVFEGLLEGLKAAEIRDALGLTVTEYESARTYINRRVNSHFRK